MPKQRVALSAAIEVSAEGALPTRVRLLREGWNDTYKGKFLFDEQAAADTLAAFAASGVDLMIDLNHDSLDDAALANREDAGDARGWGKLAVFDGELWVDGITWTPDGAERLTSKKQRYVSPVMLFDTETRRVREIVNVAICALPATKDAMPLVAASRRAFDSRIMRLSVSLSDIEYALQALVPQDGMSDCGAWVRDVFDDCFVYEYKGALWRVAYTYAEGKAAITGAPEQVKTAYVPIVKPTVATMSRVLATLARAYKERGLANGS